MWADKRLVDVLARVGELGEIVFERAGQHVAAFGELADMAGDDVVDLAAACRTSAGRPERAPEDIAAFGQLLDLAGDQPVDAERLSASLARSSSSALDSVERSWTSLSEWPCRRLLTFSRSASSTRANSRTVFGQLLRLVGNGAPDRVEIGFQRALEDVAAFGQLLDLAGNQPVDAGAAFRQLGEVVLERL